MRKLLVSILILVSIFSVICLAKPFTLVPWPYGVIAFVQTPSFDQQQFIDEASQAVRKVFSFWDLPIPVPDPDWATPTQTDSQAYYDAWYKMLMQSPSMVIQSANPFLSELQQVFGAKFPGDDPDHVMLVPYPEWSGWKIMPLTVGIFPSDESMNRLFGDYTFSGSFGSVSTYTMFRSEESWTEDEWEILHLLWNVETIIMSDQGDMHYILRHELAHWASWLWCEEHGVDPSSLPRLIIEGFADYTADSLTRDDRWRTVAASWAQQGGGLANVPRPLLYEVGTSVVNLLVQQKGKEGLLEMLVDPATDWDNAISSLTQAWRESLSYVPVSPEDLPLYTAVLQDLALCGHLLAPVLPQEADRIVQRLYAGQGTMADIDDFWELVSQVPPEPSEDVWQAMIARIPSFRLVQYQDSDPDIRMIRARLEIKLDKYGKQRDWQRFYTTFIASLREVVAHYGMQKITNNAS